MSPLSTLARSSQAFHQLAAGGSENAMSRGALFEEVAQDVEAFRTNLAFNTAAENIIGDSITDSRNKLDNLVNVTMQPNGGQLDIVGVLRIASAMTFPANIRLQFVSGAYLAPDIGVNVTINGTFNRHLEKKFGGGGTIILGPAKMPYVNPQWWGALGNGVANDTVSMQAAHNTGFLVCYPGGTYSFSTLTGIVDGGIVGVSTGKSLLVSTDTTTANLVSWTGGGTGIPSTATKVPRFSNFTLNANAAKTVGAGIQIAPPAGETHNAYFDNVRIWRAPIGVDFVAASRFKMIGCDIVDFAGGIGIQVNNTVFQDDGDSVITGCVIENMGAAVGKAINYIASAGLKVIGNKLNVCAHAVYIPWTGTGSGDLIFTGNSIENMSVSGITFARVGGSSFHNLTITDNEFSLCTDNIVIGIGAISVVITGNIFSMNTTGATKAINITSASVVSITGNVFTGNGGTPTGIALTSCDTVDVGIQTFYAMSVKTVYTTCTNLFDHNPYTGTVVTANVTFTTAFTLSSAIGFYEMFVLLPSASGGAAAISGTARIVADGGATLVKLGGEAQASTQITISGLNVQVWQNTGVSQTLSWGYRRIA